MRRNSAIRGFESTQRHERCEILERPQSVLIPFQAELEHISTRQLHVLEVEVEVEERCIGHRRSRSRRNADPSRLLFHGSPLLQHLQRRRFPVKLAQHHLLHGRLRQAVLIHHPVRFPATWRPPLVEDERLLRPQHLLRIRRAQYLLVGASRLPEAILGGPVRPAAAAVPPVAGHEEVPFPLAVDPREACIYTEVRGRGSCFFSMWEKWK